MSHLEDLQKIIRERYSAAARLQGQIDGINRCSIPFALEEGSTPLQEHLMLEREGLLKKQAAVNEQIYRLRDMIDAENKRLQEEKKRKPRIWVQLNLFG